MLRTAARPPQADSRYERPTTSITDLTGDVDVVIRPAARSPAAPIHAAPAIRRNAPSSSRDCQHTSASATGDVRDPVRQPAAVGVPAIRSSSELGVRYGTLVFAYVTTSATTASSVHARGDGDRRPRRQEVLGPVRRTVGAIASSVAPERSRPGRCAGGRRRSRRRRSRCVATRSHAYLFGDGRGSRPWRRRCSLRTGEDRRWRARTVEPRSARRRRWIWGRLDFHPPTNDAIWAHCATRSCSDGSSPTVDLLRSESAGATRRVLRHRSTRRSSRAQPRAACSRRRTAIRLARARDAGRAPCDDATRRSRLYAGGPDRESRRSRRPGG